jgi:outer membrane protein assembly factor BamB
VGQLTGLDASTGQAQWTQYIDGYVAGSDPTADGGLAIIRLDDTLEVVGLSSGRVRWTRPAGPLLIVSAASPDGPGLLTAFRMSDGHRAWQLTIPEPVTAPPSAVPGGMLVNSAIQLTDP